MSGPLFDTFPIRICEARACTRFAEFRVVRRSDGASASVCGDCAGVRYAMRTPAQTAELIWPADPEYVPPDRMVG